LPQLSLDREHDVPQMLRSTRNVWGGEYPNVPLKG
jgi:hypothetical protein